MPLSNGFVMAMVASALQSLSGGPRSDAELRRAMKRDLERSKPALPELTAAAAIAAAAVKAQAATAAAAAAAASAAAAAPGAAAAAPVAASSSRGGSGTAAAATAASAASSSTGEVAEDAELIQEELLEVRLFVDVLQVIHSF